MKQVVLRNGQPLVADVPAPSPQPGRVLVASAASVISSGTERAAVSDGGGSLPMRAVRNPDLVLLTLRHAREHGVRDTVELVRNAVSDDTVLGYACAGVVLDTGGLGDFSVGQEVACAGAGRANHAEVVSVPGNLEPRCRRACRCAMRRLRRWVRSPCRACAAPRHRSASASSSSGSACLVFSPFRSCARPGVW